ncbi:hypothetical protein BDN70DRAFT_877185 [Pholiota conissans]|uniref:Uncharacterized protein n=1 Tax=Pholiota conissans TaxID=109636 RepID=A0A9P5Z654_9AGAR|nr:hypothetical protein BDN70DRAFT_877185 [Pholiota conissans]
MSRWTFEVEGEDRMSKSKVEGRSRSIERMRSRKREEEKDSSDSADQKDEKRER